MTSPSSLPPTARSKHTQKKLRQIKWNHLKVFYYVATCRSFTLAADHLYVSQSSISSMIIRLEKHLGTPLFYRTARQPTLTQAGQIVLNMMARNFANTETMLQQIDAHLHHDYGHIRVWAGGGFLRLYLSPYVPSFLRQHPDIHLHLASSKVIPDLDLLQTDVVIRPPLPGRDDLTQIPLLINHVKLYASAAYLDKHGTPHTIQDLDAHQLIAYGHPPGLAGYNGMNWHLEVGRPKGQERIALIEVDQPEERLELAAADLGITTASQEHPGLANYGLVEVLPHLSKPTVPCYYIYATHLQASRRIQILKDYLVDCFTRDYGVPMIAPEEKEENIT